MDQHLDVIDVSTPAVSLRALMWGPSNGPIALCLHGFPDTAYGWRKVAPLLAAAGWKVVAPFLRGYAPSSIPTDAAYHAPALMDDALRVLTAAGPTGNDVVIGHDFGAVAATGLAAMPDSPFTKAVTMAAPPYAAFRPVGRVPNMGALLAQLARQAVMSWYIMFMHLPWIPERSREWLLPRLWRGWSPGYDATEDLRLVDTAIGAPEHWRAAITYYRSMKYGTRKPPQYRELRGYWLSRPVLPTLYLHGIDDGCASPGLLPWVKRILPEHSSAHTINGAGHFLHLEQPERVAEHILDFIGRPQ